MKWKWVLVEALFILILAMVGIAVWLYFKGN